MPLALYKPKDLAFHPTSLSEDTLSSIDFRVSKFSNRPKPTDRNRIVIISCFSEFGCETVGCVYCIPKMIRSFPGQYIIGMGWSDREYLYRHLLDEFWEIDEKHIWLRDYVYAFHHRSKNLKRLEESATKYGRVVPSAALGALAINNSCKTCGHTWKDWRHSSVKCGKCNSTNIIYSIFGNVKYHKQFAVKIPHPGAQARQWASTIIPPRCVGIFARNRKTYGRNLPPDFYVRLINRLTAQGYQVVWLGEKQSTLECPVPGVLDLTRHATGDQNLERTLAVIQQCSFTIQFWTASSRLSGLMGTPFILFESPEQIYSTGSYPGQEGRRIELMSFGPKKIVIAHYKRVLENQSQALDAVSQAITEMQDDNWEDIVALVENEKYIKELKEEFYKDMC